MYNVTITKQQNPKDVRKYEDQTKNQVLLILEKYHNDQFLDPEWDGESHELNSDEYIKIEKL